MALVLVLGSGLGLGLGLGLGPGLGLGLGLGLVLANPRMLNLPGLSDGVLYVAFEAVLAHLLLAH